MCDLATVLAVATLPALATVVGALVAEAVTVTERVLSLVLHLAAGIVLAVVGLELMPAALAARPAWIPVVAFVAGGVVFMGLERLIGLIRARLADPASSNRPLAIFSGVWLDLLSDGIMIGTGSLVNPVLGLLLALGQTPADLPEGFAATATLRRAGYPVRVRLLVVASVAVPVLFGAALGYLALRAAPEVLTLSVLAATGGVLTSVVLEEMITEAHEGQTSPLGPLLLTAGFGLFALVSVTVPA